MRKMKKKAQSYSNDSGLIVFVSLGFAPTRCGPAEGTDASAASMWRIDITAKESEEQLSKGPDSILSMIRARVEQATSPLDAQKIPCDADADPSPPSRC